MSLLTLHFFSKTLVKHVSMNVIVPDTAPPSGAGGGGGWPVFYLLHGLSDDYSKWHRSTSIERYAASYPFLIAMPDGFRGCYTNNEEGPRYFDYLVEDVIGEIERLFNVRTDRGGRCVGGLSMGGYGAALLGLRRPDLFNSVNSHSGALLLGSKRPEEYEGGLDCGEFIRIFGRDPIGSDHDLIALAKKRLAEGAMLPHMRLDCGRDDFIFSHSERIHAEWEAAGLLHEYALFDGEHNWVYWDEHVQEALAFHAHHLK